MPTLPERVSCLESQAEECRRTNSLVVRIYDAVAGEEALDGVRRGGIVGRLGQVEAKLANGGVRARLGPKEWATLLAALASGLGAALIGLLK